YARDFHAAHSAVAIDERLKPAENPPFSDKELSVMGLLCEAALGVGIVCHLLSLRAMMASFRRPGLALLVVAYLLLVVASFAGVNVLLFRQSKELGPLNLGDVETTARLALGGVALLALGGLLTTALVRGGI